MAKAIGSSTAAEPDNNQNTSQSEQCGPNGQHALQHAFAIWQAHPPKRRKTPNAVAPIYPAY